MRLITCLLISLVPGKMINAQLMDSLKNYPLTVAKVDSICSSIDLGKNSRCTIACGSIASRENCYTADNDDILLSCNGFVYLRDTFFNYHYYYLDNQPIKATLSFRPRTKGNPYSATYYFSGNRAIQITGEDEKISDTAWAFSFATAHTYWFPKKRKQGYE